MKTKIKTPLGWSIALGASYLVSELLMLGACSGVKEMGPCMFLYFSLPAVILFLVLILVAYWAKKRQSRFSKAIFGVIVSVFAAHLAIDALFFSFTLVDIFGSAYYDLDSFFRGIYWTFKLN